MKARSSIRRPVFGRDGRKDQRDRGSLTGLAADTDAAAHVAHDFVADGKPQALPPAHALGGEKRLEDTALEVWADTDARIGHADRHRSGRGPGTDGDAMGTIARFTLPLTDDGIAGVFHQVVEHLHETAAMA
ncbi:hypothetical protein DESC_120031 [Desulfosarcina cetonica]|nr:hypothetical protein DESC_120031 [Desulfosarcina cetonica]